MKNILLLLIIFLVSILLVTRFNIIKRVQKGKFRLTNLIILMVCGLVLLFLFKALLEKVTENFNVLKKIKKRIKSKLQEEQKKGKQGLYYQERLEIVKSGIKKVKEELEENKKIKQKIEKMNEVIKKNKKKLDNINDRIKQIRKDTQNELDKQKKIWKKKKEKKEKKDKQVA